MAFIECDLEELIMNSSSEELYKRGLNIGEIKKRQLIIGNYGKCDIVSLIRPSYFEECEDGYNTWDFDKVTIQIIELKANEIGWDAFHQIIRYVRGIQRYLSKRKLYPKIEIILIGKTISKNSDSCYLPDIFENVYLYTYKYEIDGIHFTLEYGYNLTDERF